MNVLATPRFTVDEFLAWAQGLPGRYELFQGEVFKMSPETTGHTKIKGNVYVALRAGIRAGRLPCHVLTDGVIIRIDERTAYEPDAQGYCGAELADTAFVVPEPMIVVEVLSPSTQRIDEVRKLADYFRLPSVMHYVIVSVAKPLVVHHARSHDGTITTRIVTEGSITLDPPGLELSLCDVYEG